jgi:hypothetical protein
MPALHTAKPAREVSAEPVSKNERLGSELVPSNNPKSDRPQAPDNRGENDETFFRRRPNARQRLRLPFPAELPLEIWQPAAAAGVAGFVIVTRGAPGAPWTRSRQFVFAAGGTA